jgi:hypothetical protein
MSFKKVETCEWDPLSQVEVLARRGGAEGSATTCEKKGKDSA